jgi:hypothetical protein
MKFSKEKLRELVDTYGQRQLVPDDGFHTLKVGMVNDLKQDEHLVSYYRSKYCLFFEQVVTHRAQEGEAVKDNVATSIHNLLYREIIVNLHQIKHECRTATREEVIDMLTRLIDRLES